MAVMLCQLYHQCYVYISRKLMLCTETTVHFRFHIGVIWHDCLWSCCGCVRRMIKASVDCMQYWNHSYLLLLGLSQHHFSICWVSLCSWLLLLNCSTSSFEDMIPNPWSSSILVFSWMTTPRAICSKVGLLLTSEVTMFPTMAAGRFLWSFSYR